MISFKVYGLRSRDTLEDIEEDTRLLPKEKSRLVKDTKSRLHLQEIFNSLNMNGVIGFIDSDVIDKNGNCKPYLAISASIEMPKRVILRLGNVFLREIDVEISYMGVKVFRAQRDGFFHDHFFDKKE